MITPLFSFNAPEEYNVVGKFLWYFEQLLGNEHLALAVASGLICIVTFIVMVSCFVMVTNFTIKHEWAGCLDTLMYLFIGFPCAIIILVTFFMACAAGFKYSIESGFTTIALILIIPLLFLFKGPIMGNSAGPIYRSSNTSNGFMFDGKQYSSRQDAEKARDEKQKKIDKKVNG